MLTIRYLIRLLLAFIARFKAVIFLGIFFGIVVFLLLKIFGSSLFTSTTEKIGIVGRYRFDNLPENVLVLIGNGLTRVNEDGTISPDLAVSWETPDKGQTWIFKLKEDAFWQDGKKVRSDSINYEFSDAKIDRPAPDTVVFKLESPFAPFPYVVSKPSFKKGLLGTGEWRVSKATMSSGFVQRLTLTNKEGDRKIIKFYPTEERAKLSYKLGEVDILQGILNPKPFNEWRVVTFSADVNTQRMAVIFFNTQDKLLGEKSLRQALIYAIAKDKFNGPRAISPISPDSWAYNPQVKPYDYDRQRAKELIDDLPKELKVNLSLSLVTTPALLSLGEGIVKDWQEVGVNAAIKVSSGVPGDFQAFLAIFDVPQDPDQYAIWHSTQTSANISHYQNPRIDKLLEDGRIELNTEERKKVYLDFQRFLVEDSPAAFLYHPVSYTITRK
ncbi:MAG: ABC transporter substrate-binding protein [Patescibacteria group bacterium]